MSEMETEKEEILCFQYTINFSIDGALVTF